MNFPATQPFKLFTDSDGAPLEDGYLYFGVANQNPQTNPTAIYWDVAATIPAAQPIRTLNGYPVRDGSPAIVYLPGNYSITVRDKKNRLVFTAPTSSDYEWASYAKDLAIAEIDASLNLALGAGKIGYSHAETYPDSTVGSTLNSREVVITDAPYGAKSSATPSANRASIQAAIDACPQGGTVLIPNGTFNIDDELVISKAITIRGLGPGKFINSLGGSIIRQTNAVKNVFTLRASLGQWAFGQYGLLNVNFQDLAITGPAGYPSARSNAARGIGCDTTVNGGDYHIRECTFTNLEVRYFNTGIELIGICYLNDFYGGCISECDTGFALYKGLATDRGGQIRFFGTTIDLITDACIQWNPDTTSGDLSLFGCTLADSAYGIVANEETTLTVSGCSFENLKKPLGLGAGILIQIKESNPSSDAAKTITGNKFLLSDCDIWIDCINASTAAGQFNWPMLIDSNVMLSPEALRITMPVGALPMSSSQFVLGASNSGLNAGILAASQVSANFAGQFTFNRVVRRRYAIGVGSPSTIDQLPPGLFVTKARVCLTANATSFTQLFFGDSANNTRYVQFDATTQPLNTWVEWTPAVPTFQAASALECSLICSGTAGYQGYVGVAEIEGYIDYKLN